MMGCIPERKENEVLKLIHPHGVVELYFRPITASQVMKKNPRHFVTRPDFFKDPTVVVRPESVLNTGDVFYIVPCHTVHSLSRAYETSLSRERNSLPDHSHNYNSHEGALPPATSQVDEKLGHQTHDWRHSRQSSIPMTTELPDQFSPEMSPNLSNQSSPVMTQKHLARQLLLGESSDESPTEVKQPSRDNPYLHEETWFRSWVEYTPAWENRHRRTRNWTDAWSDVTTTYQDRILSGKSWAGSLCEVSLPYQDADQQSPGSGSSEGTTNIQDDDNGLTLTSSNQVNKLKSCFRKPGDCSSSSSHYRRVTFDLPRKDKKATAEEIHRFNLFSRQHN